MPEGLDSGVFAKWVEPPPAPVEVAAKLFIDLVPNTAWFSNLRSELTPDEWNLVKKATYVPASYRCTVCGGRGTKHPVECHERWQYDMVAKVQKLVGTIALCPACHESTHYGLAQVRGRDVEARQHLMAVNHWTEAQANRHIRQTMDLWRRRSCLNWTLDARWLLGFVALSELTKKKIEDHAAGLCERKVDDWQRDVIGLSGASNIAD